MEVFEIEVFNGLYYAPSIFVLAKSYNEAVKEAKKRSRLSDFPQWEFI